MWEAVETVALLWTALILAYGVIALALILGRWALNRARTGQTPRQVLEHQGPLPHSPQGDRQ
jgi:hypothetical protein